MNNQENRLISAYLEKDALWKKFIDTKFFNAKNVRWSQSSRVYKYENSAVKIQDSNFPSNEHNLKHEFKILSKLEKKINWSMEPEIHFENKDFQVLKMNWIDGKNFDYLINNKKLLKIKISTLISILFKVSLSGVCYSQLRARHSYLKKDNTIVFIDFGGSRFANIIEALFYNLKLFEINFKKKSIASCCLPSFIFSLKCLAPLTAK